MEIELDIFFNTSETSTLNDLGVEFSLNQSETRKVTFYNINGIAPYFDKDDTEYCAILSNGSEFIANETYTVIKNKIKNLKT